MGKGGKCHPALEFLVRRRDQFRRYFLPYSGNWYKISPKKLKFWIDEISLDVHKEFYAELVKREPRRKEKVSVKAEPSASVVERETLLKLIAAMACEQYGFDPTKQRSRATSSIRDDIETVGLTMDSKTILKWLKEAVELVPKEYWED